VWGETDEGTGAARLRSDTRGVQWTLEAFLAVLLLLSAVVAVAAVVPTGTQQATAELTQERLQAAGADVLTLAQQEGRLEAALLHYDTAEGSFVGTDVSIDGIDRYSTFEGSEHPLAPLFGATLAEQRISYNVDLVYDAGGTTERRPLVSQGPPGTESVTTTATVGLSDEDRPARVGRCKTLGELGNCPGERFYAPDANPGGTGYNLVTVELELWRA
jgi:hypothetical protein